MENASKALIIAGAILIAILLISVGMMVLGSADEIVGGAKESMDAQQIQMFNSEFENYRGQQRGSSVRQLMSKVKASNASHDDQHQVTVESTITGVTKAVEGEGVDPDSVSNNVRPTTTYTVTITSDPKSALIKSIKVENVQAENK